MAVFSAQGAGSSMWIATLGTNDDDDPDAATSRIARLCTDAQGRPVLWLTLVRPGNYEAVNTAMSAFARTHPQLHIIDWASEVNAHPDWLASDGVHLTSHGYDARAQTIVAAAANAAR